ncbi:reverse transcriptase-rnase h-integrase [Moniliophthora roreri MCA 2997]|uniref:Reverse transcriptase-rnase h-integrase n=2 Tax=Moniliophthora roreri TaxID=221103 RepID=V2WZ56_MONRO|nr:reverse transcriptase-rnase h-integrase [Moniliophthora roreri MCA 2997]
MNTVNSSTGFTGFQLHLGRSSRVVPLLVHIDDSASAEEIDAAEVIEHLHLDTMDAQDAFLHVKVNQAHQTNNHHSSDPAFAVGDKVWLAMKNRCHNYLQKNKNHVAKFVPRFNGPYIVESAYPELSTYTLHIPGAHKNTWLTFHSSHLKPWTPNDNELFPQHQHQHPGPIVTKDGIEEYFIEKIINECK